MSEKMAVSLANETLYQLSYTPKSVYLQRLVMIL